MQWHFDFQVAGRSWITVLYVDSWRCYYWDVEGYNQTYRTTCPAVGVGQHPGQVAVAGHPALGRFYVDFPNHLKVKFLLLISNWLDRAIGPACYSFQESDAV